MEDNITFSFGANWRSYVDSVSEEAVLSARKDIEDWLGRDGVAGKTVLDAGCGSGIHSLCFALMGAAQVVSFDLDPKSVEATNLLREQAGAPSHWRVLQGSVLDQTFLSGLGSFDVVYSWGVLHHTGAMWEAVDNVCGLVAPNGHLWIALYAKGPNYQRHLALKRKYNSASNFGKRLMEWRRILPRILDQPRRFGRKKLVKLILALHWSEALEAFKWNRRKERGMDVYHDLVDWLGGLPYEVAGVEEVKAKCSNRGLTMLRVTEAPEGANSNYLLVKQQQPLGTTQGESK